MQLALPLLGAAVAPTLGFAATTGWLAGSLLYGLTQGTKKGRPTIHETGAQTVMEGAPLGIVYGTAPLTGNVIAAGPIRKIETPIKQRKGGGTVGTEVQYLCTYAVAIGEPIEAILMVKADGAIVYDARPGNDFLEDNVKFLERCTIYYGDEDQLPDPDLEAIYGAGEVPAYRGISYIVFKDDDLSSRGGSLKQWEFLCSGEGGVYTPAEEIHATSSVELSDAGGAFTNSTVSYADLTDSLSSFSSGVSLIFWEVGPGMGADKFMRLRVRDGSVDGTLLYEEVSPALNYGGTRSIVRVQVNHDKPSTNLYLQFDILGGSISVTTHAWSLHSVSSSAKTAVHYVPGEIQFVSSGSNDFGIVEESGFYTSASRPFAGAEIWRGLGPGGSSIEWETGEPPEIVPKSLKSIVDDIHARCGAEPPDSDDLEDIDVHGVVFGSSDYTGAGAIDIMRPIYHFDRVEADGEIRYVARGAAAVATITEDDLVDLDDAGDREAQADYPRKVLLTALNPNANYETAVVPSERYSPDIRVNGESSLTVPIVMDEEEMTRCVDTMHKVLWAEAEGEVKFSLPYKWIWLTPGDCVVRSIGGQSRRIRIEEISDADFVRSITGKFDRSGSYTSTRTPHVLPTPTPPVSRVVGDTVLAVMDIPALSESDDSLVGYLAVTAEGPAWTGAVVQRSLDDGETFGSVTTLGPSVLGLLVDAVTNASEFYTDTTNVVRVQLIRDGHEVLSISEASFLSGGGGFALEKGDGSWEVMQYLDAEDEGDGVFKLTTLHRGQLNSKPAAHAPGAKFVLLSGAAVAPMESSWIGRDLVHRAPSIGQVAEEADQQTQEFVGRSQLEWPVVHLILERDGDDIVGSWVPRYRFGAEIAPVASINFQGFRVTLDDGVDVVTFDTTETGFTYDASALGTPVDVTVSAINRITGPGEATTEEIA